MRSFLVAYDISRDSARAQVSARLQAWGDRLQESVFLCRADDAARQVLVDALTSIIEPNTDALLVMPLCEGCLSGMDAHGQYAPPEHVTCWIVL